MTDTPDNADTPETSPTPETPAAEGLSAENHYYCENYSLFIDAVSATDAVRLVTEFKRCSAQGLIVGRAKVGKWAKLGDKVLRACIVAGTGKGTKGSDGKEIPEKMGYEYVTRLA